MYATYIIINSYKIINYDLGITSRYHNVRLKGHKYSLE